MKNRKLRLIGYLFMLIGISLPLYTFTNLVYNDYKSKSMYEDFKKSQSNISEEELNKLEEEIKNYNKNWIFYFCFILNIFFFV